MYRFDDEDDGPHLAHGGERDTCGAGRGGWKKRQLAGFLHDVEPGLPPRATARLNKAAMCTLLRRLARTEDLSDAHLDFRLADLDRFVRALGFDDGDRTVARLELGERPARRSSLCLPKLASGYRMQVMRAGQSGSAVFLFTRHRSTPVVCKAAAVPSATLGRTDFIDAMEAREAYMHAEATQLLLLDRASPGVVAHGVSYLCLGQSVNGALGLAPSSRRKLTLITMMERGDRTLYDELRAGALRHDDDCRRVFFRVLHALACWRHKLPGARHNDLHAQNVLMVRAPSQSHDVFVMGRDEVYYVPPAPYLPALYDFGHAQAPGTPYPTKEGKCGMGAAPDGGYYDLHTLFSSVLRVAARAGRELPPETTAFLGRVVPAAARVPQHDGTHGRLWRGKPTATAEQAKVFDRMARGEVARRLLRRDAYFAPFREVPAGGAPAAANVWRL